MQILAHTLTNTEWEDILGVAIDYGNRLLEFQLPGPPQEDTRSQSQTQARRRPGMAAAEYSVITEEEGSTSGEGDHPTGDQALPKTDLGWSYMPGRAYGEPITSSTVPLKA
jgi:hypothetical protein